MKIHHLFLTILILSFFSCNKEELPIEKHNAGNVLTASVDVGSDYKWQIYYDLKTNSVVGKNLKSAWDLGFETGETGFHIIINSSKAMNAFNTGITNFESITDTLGFSFGKKCDVPSGNLDSTAIGNWQSSDVIYIIDRGYNEAGTHQGFKKIKFQSVNSLNYTIRFANLDGTNEVNLINAKDSLYNFTFLSFNTGNTLIIEPPKDNWDLVFTQYTHIFYEPEITSYLVSGCILNRFKTESLKTIDFQFSMINFSTVENLLLSSAINVIGYDWKTYIGGLYVTNSNLYYIIKDQDGIFYKLHFIDFYNESGVKGNPTWEYQKL